MIQHDGGFSPDHSDYTVGASGIEYKEGGPRYDVKVIFDGAYLQAEQDDSTDPEWEAAWEVFRFARAELLLEMARDVSERWFTMHIADDQDAAKLVHDWITRHPEWKATEG